MEEQREEARFKVKTIELDQDNQVGTLKYGYKGNVMEGYSRRLDMF